jgi:ketosteroid isomerase-like protein
MNEAHKDVVRRINRGFEAGDEQAILDCLTDDVVWHVPPHFTATGKEGFRQHISSPAADGPPVIDLRSLVAEGEIVAVEGFVTNRFKGGGMFRGLFHNVYRFRDGKICRMTSYVVPLPESGWDPDITR